MDSQLQTTCLFKRSFEVRREKSGQMVMLGKSSLTIAKSLPLLFRIIVKNNKQQSVKEKCDKIHITHNRIQLVTK